MSANTRGDIPDILCMLKCIALVNRLRENGSIGQNNRYYCAQETRT